MATTSGTVGLSVQMKDSLATSATRLTGYDVPVQYTSTITYGNGSTANAVNKCYQASGSAAAAVVDTDLTAVTCTDGTTGFSYIRELIITNTDTTNSLTLGLGTNPFTSQFLGGTSPTVTIYPGMSFRIFKSLGTTGITVDSTHKIVRIDPSSNTIAYQIIAFGS
jgi:hypothetical protein